MFFGQDRVPRAVNINGVSQAEGMKWRISEADPRVSTSRLTPQGMLGGSYRAPLCLIITQTGEVMSGYVTQLGVSLCVCDGICAYLCVCVCVCVCGYPGGDHGCAVECETPPSLPAGEQRSLGNPRCALSWLSALTH